MILEAIELYDVLKDFYLEITEYVNLDTQIEDGISLFSNINSISSNVKRCPLHEMLPLNQMPFILTTHPRWTKSPSKRCRNWTWRRNGKSNQQISNAKWRNKAAVYGLYGK